MVRWVDSEVTPRVQKADTRKEELPLRAGKEFVANVANRVANG